MDNVKNDAYYLNKILTDLCFMIEHTRGKSQYDIEHDPVLVDSILFRLIQVAENSDRLSGEFKQSSPALPWKAIKGMRNVIVHDYGIVDLTIVCDTVLNSVPALYTDLKAVL